MRTRACTIANALLAAGALLVVVNLIGVVDYTTIPNNHPKVLDNQPRKVSEHEFWERARRNPQEIDEKYVARLSALISDRMLTIDPHYAKPTFFENWIVWTYSQYLGYYEWIDTRRAVRLGGGFCSQHAIVLNNMLRDQSFESRIVGLNGHVVNEVLLHDHWRVFDPDYNVAFNASVKELESDPDRAYQAYLSAGFTEDESRCWADMFRTERDNWHFKSSQHYGTTFGCLVERFSFAAIWAVPLLLLTVGLGIYRWEAGSNRVPMTRRSETRATSTYPS